MTPRLFVALEIPPHLVEALAERCRRLRASYPKARWVRPAAMHLTLSFLGDTDAEDLPALERELGAAFGTAPPLALRLAGAGAFPPRGKARVLWAGVVDGASGDEPAALLILRRAVVEAVARALDHEPERRPFHPHVTLARLQPPWSRERALAFTEEIAQTCDGALGEPFTVCSGTLFESELHPSGARYRVVGTYPLETMR